MDNCQVPKPDKLPDGVVYLDLDLPNCDFECAKKAAIERAKTYDAEPKLVSWFDKRAGKFFPDGDSCVDGEPSWIAYAKSKGGNLTVNVNNEEYVFIFHEPHGMM